MLIDLLEKKYGKNDFTGLDYLVLVLIAGFGLLLRLMFIDLQFPDYTVCLRPWVETFKSYGGFPGLKYEIGNYTPAYMHLLMIISYFDVEPLYVIKGVGIALDFVLAGVACLFFVQEQQPWKKLLVFGTVLMLPTVIANSGVWGQCDNIYTIFVLLAFYACRKDIKWTLRLKKHVLHVFQNDEVVMILLGMAFSFKIQTIFVLPVLALVFLQKRYRLLSLLWIFVVYFMTLIPSWIAGRSFKDLLLIYFHQTQSFSEMQLDFPNIYSFWQFDELAGQFGTCCILFCGLSLVIFVYYLYQKRVCPDVEFISVFLTFSITYITFLLPHMHDRYAYVAEITALVYLLKKERLWIPIVMNLLALAGYAHTLLWFDYPGINTYGALIRIGLILILGRDLLVLADRKSAETQMEKVKNENRNENM